MQAQHSDSEDGLSGKLLIAMPGIGDPRFDRSVIFMCAHSEDGAMGLIVNKPASDLRFEDLLEQLNITPTTDLRAIKVNFGGPVENGRGFVLHSADYEGTSSTLQINTEIGMTSTLDILEDLARGEGPQHCFLALGYAGWGPGQLEDELQRNGWLTTDPSHEILFGAEAASKWERALGTLGIDPVMLSSTGGRA